MDEQSDNTQTWSVVIWKISAQYVKACKRKERKTVFQVL